MAQAQALQTDTLTDEAIQDVTQVLNSNGANDISLAQIKAGWPQYRFILCSEYDMGAKEPYFENSNFQLYLIAASLGCASLTRQPENAIGLVIAAIEDDD